MARLAKIEFQQRKLASLPLHDGKETAYRDSKCDGLELRIYPTGRRVFTFRYCDGRGADRRLTMGALSEAFDLEAARRRARQLRTRVDKGEDPQTDKTVAAAIIRHRPVHTVSDLIDLYLGHAKVKAKLSASTYENYTYRLRKYVEPRFGALPLEMLKRPQLRAFVEEMGVKTPITANRVLTVVSAVYTFAIKNDLDVYNPASGIDQFPEPPRKQTLTNPQIARLWAGLSEPSLPPSPPMAIAIKLALLTLQRASEVLGMRDDELDFTEPDYPLWEIPAHRMKSKRIHVVPLAPQAVALIEQARALRGARVNRGLPLFPSENFPDEPMTRHAMTRGFKRLCTELKMDNLTVHDMRRTGRTRLTRESIGASYETAERVIDHLVGSAVSRVYDQNDYISEKRKALEDWANQLDKIVNLHDGVNASSLRERFEDGRRSQQTAN